MMFSPQRHQQLTGQNYHNQLREARVPVCWRPFERRSLPTSLGRLTRNQSKWLQPFTSAVCRLFVQVNFPQADLETATAQQQETSIVSTNHVDLGKSNYPRSTVRCKATP